PVMTTAEKKKAKKKKKVGPVGDEQQPVEPEKPAEGPSVDIPAACCAVPAAKAAGEPPADLPPEVLPPVPPETEEQKSVILEMPVEGELLPADSKKDKKTESSPSPGDYVPTIEPGKYV